jgi:solute carrier family 25 S-adenosylmethionine transporter 26
MKINPTWSGSNQPLVPQPLIDSVSSSVAELASCIILTPAEVIKQNAQVIRRPAHGSSKLRGSSIVESSVTWQVLKGFREKPSHIFRGYTALAARNLPFTAIQFPFFEYLKTAINSHRQKNGTHKGLLTETAIVTAISAGVAGTAASTVTTPVDVIKTRIMLSASHDGHDKEGSTKSIENGDLKGQSEDKTSHGRRPKMSGFTVARDVIQESGFKGLFRGVVLRCIWAALGSGLYLGLYESSRVWLGDRRKEMDA